MPSVRIRIARSRFAGLALGLGMPAGASARAAADSSTCKYFSQLPDDCARAEQRKFDNLRGYRYVEIDLYARDALKKLPYVSVYNTTGLNDGDDARDSAPKSLVDRLDPKKIAKQYQALRVAISPPPHLDDRLVGRSGRRGAQLRRARGGLDGQQPGSRASKLAAQPAAAVAGKRSRQARLRRLPALAVRRENVD